MSSQQRPKIAQLILAAGASSRMGAPKQLLPWKDTTLIGHAITQSLAIEEVSTFVVLGAHYELIYNQINKFPVTILNNVNWQSGMGSSIQIGVKTILAHDLSFDAVLISLIDQPLIKLTDYNALITKFIANTNPIVASDLGSRIGVPAIFSKDIFMELMQLEEDYGARYIIKKYINQIKTISIVEKGIDIDTKQQYQKIIDNKFSK